MRWGVNLPTKGPLASPEAIHRVALEAERLGFSTVWASDHVVIPVGFRPRHPGGGRASTTWDPGITWYDPFLALTWAAASTSRVRLGTSVLVLPLRPALLVAKLAATLDDLSGGRLTLGLGSGWLAEEFTLLGQSFSDRGARMTEAIRLLRSAWSEEVVRFDGRFHAPTPFGMGPKPGQPGGIPILIGGHSDAALGRVAEVGDGWHPSRLWPEEVSERLERLDRELDRRGRSREDLQLVVRCPEGVEPDRAARLAGDYRQLGVKELLVELNYERESVEAALDDLERLASEASLRPR